MNIAFATYLFQTADFLDEALGSIQYTHSYWIFLAPLLLQATDIITGWVQAIINRTLDSTKMRYGFMRKAVMILIIIVFYLLEYAIDAVAQAHLATFASGYVLVMEGISIFENLVLAGVPVPPFVKERLKKVKESMDNAGNIESVKEQ